ncbi:MAG: regulatory protein GemA [Gemmobacter sp.]|nr:regulatory protein GemA [Gemmobacter sp.]
MADRSLQRMIHTACRQLGLDEDARRGLQVVATGKASMADMSDAELRQVVAALQARGFKPGGNSYFNKGSKGSSKPRRPAASRADLRYVHVLWGLLGKAGHLDRPGRDGLNAFVRSRFEAHWSSVPIEIDTLRDAGQINDVIQALQGMCRRHGVKVQK